MALEIINTLLLLGAAQGLFLAVLLATKHTNHAANLVLAVAMLAFSIFVLESLYYTRGWYREFPHFMGVSVPLPFLFGPVLYIYARAVSEGALPRRTLLHFIPFALVVLYFLPVYLQDGAGKITYLETIFRQGPPRDLALIQLLQYPHGITYVVLTIAVLRRHRRKLRDTHSNLERVNLVWLRNLTVGIVAVWALATGAMLAELAGVNTHDAGGVGVALAVAAMVYAIGYLGLRQPEIFHRPQPASVPEVIAVREEEAAGYEKSSLTREQAEAYAEKLLRLMEEQHLYRDSLLTLEDLARELRISTHHLSQVINTQLGKNFYDFVNGYRVEEIKARLRDAKAAHLTILAIALEAGFNTKSSFNAFFKKQTGMTPSQYRSDRDLVRT